MLHTNGAQVDLQTETGMSALMHASQEGYNDVVELLLKKEAQVDLNANDGFTALMTATQ